MPLPFLEKTQGCSCLFKIRPLIITQTCLSHRFENLSADCQCGYVTLKQQVWYTSFNNNSEEDFLFFIMIYICSKITASALNRSGASVNIEDLRSMFTFCMCPVSLTFAPRSSQTKQTMLLRLYCLTVLTFTLVSHSVTTLSISREKRTVLSQQLLHLIEIINIEYRSSQGKLHIRTVQECKTHFTAK